MTLPAPAAAARPASMSRMHPLGGLQRMPLRKLQALAAVSDLERRLVEAALTAEERFTSGAELVGEGEPLTPRFLAQGWACRVRALADGRRHIMGLYLPGDGIALHHRPGALAPWTVIALTPVTVLDGARLMRAGETGQAKGLTAALRAAELMETDLAIDHSIRLGPLSAYERVAHLLMELHQRCAMVGLGNDERFPLPLTQEVIRECLSLSAVHLNRILGRLRREELGELRGGFAKLRTSEVAMICDYGSSRLSLGAQERRATAAADVGRGAGSGQP